MAPKDQALALLATFDPMDVATNIALRTPDCIWQMAPASMGFPPNGMDNNAHEAHLNGIKAVLDRFPVTPKEVWEGKGEKGWVVTVWATSEAIFRESVKDGECCWSSKSISIFIFGFWFGRLCLHGKTISGFVMGR